MQLLNTKRILECDEDEAVIHNEEIKRELEDLLNYPNYECAAIIQYFDIAHKDREPIIEQCLLHDCQDVLEFVDLKNGVDLAIVDGFLTFIVYGQFYSMIDETHCVETGIQIRPYNEDREFITVLDMKGSY